MSAAVVVLLAAGLLLHRLAFGSLRLLPPVLLFACVLAGLEWIGNRRITPLGAHTVAAFLWSTALIRLFPWRRLARTIEPGSTLFPAVLFLLVTRHFAGIVVEEARRLLVARSLAAPRRLGPDAFRSLVCAVAALFLRSLTRAERFYAARSLEEQGG